MKQLQTLKLADTLVPLVWNEDKTATVRTGYRDIQPGALVLEAADGGWPDTLVTVTEVLHTTVADMPARALRAEGLFDTLALLNSLRCYYPDVTLESPVTAILWTDARFRDGAGPAPSQLAA